MTAPEPAPATRGHRAHPAPRPAAAAALALLLAASGCSTVGRELGLPVSSGTSAAELAAAGFETAAKPEKSEYADSGALARFEQPASDRYRLGPGDEMRIDVWGRPELSGEQTVGPDGRVTLAVVGPVRVLDLTVEEASAAVTRAVSGAYANAAATVSMRKYAANRVSVLGRVANPGVLQFEGQPRLLDVITRAGGLPIGGIGADKAALTRCAIFRGRDQVVWVDLKSLLSGRNLQLNIRLQRDDLVYVPDANDQLVYVLGYVGAPGAYTLTPDMSYLDALTQAGGPTPDAAPSRLKLVRPSKHMEADIDMNDFLAGNAKANYALEEGDILYVPSNTLAKVGYLMQKIVPGTSLAAFGLAAAK